ncbi:MAG: hypothetical protein LBG84_10065 [Treponema sp.]|jgi:predicted aspartyl protease|nr:hypothetical protein [Treponema sp.]
MKREVGKVTEEITLINAGDRRDASRGCVPESGVRQVTVEAGADTGASTLVIGEELRQKLGLMIEDPRRTLFANGVRAECGVTEPVLIRWKDRDRACRAVVIPGGEQILLGAIPLEDMDLPVDPARRCLVGAHGDVVEALAL